MPGSLGRRERSHGVLHSDRALKLLDSLHVSGTEIVKQG